MWVWRRLRSATLCRASLRCGGARGAVCGRKLARSSQNGWRMALYLEGKTTVDTNELSPKEATQMSYDVKYIGMDVHKEAIVIAVLKQWEDDHGNHPRNESQQHSAVYPRSTGRAACDLGRRHLGGLAVRSAAAPGAAHCGVQSAPQCLVKGGQQERQGGCAEAGRLVTHGHAAAGLPRRKWTADAARVGTKLSDHQQRFDARDESNEGAVSRLGHSLCRHPGLCCALSRGMVEQAPTSRGAPPGGAALSTAGWIAGLAARGATRVFGRGAET